MFSRPSKSTLTQSSQALSGPAANNEDDDEGCIEPEGAPVSQSITATTVNRTASRTPRFSDAKGGQSGTPEQQARISPNDYPPYVAAMKLHEEAVKAVNALEVEQEQLLAERRMASSEDNPEAKIRSLLSDTAQSNERLEQLRSRIAQAKKGQQLAYAEMERAAQKYFLLRALEELPAQLLRLNSMLDLLEKLRVALGEDCRAHVDYQQRGGNACNGLRRIFLLGMDNDDLERLITGVKEDIENTERGIEASKSAAYMAQFA